MKSKAPRVLLPPSVSRYRVQVCAPGEGFDHFDSRFYYLIAAARFQEIIIIMNAIDVKFQMR